jgi:hypothetical protein
MSYSNQPPYDAPPPPPPYGGGYGPGGYGPGYGAPPPNNLVWAILSTVLCCLPLGVASIVFASQVNSKWAMGDVQGAYDSARKAKSFAMWSAIAGVVGGILYVVFFVLIGIGSNGFDPTTF